MDDTYTPVDPVDNEKNSVDIGPFAGNEISKEEVKKDVSKRADYLWQQFYKAAVMKSKGNDDMIRFYFHCVMGAYMKNYTVIQTLGSNDLRIPIIWVQDSRSGKSQLNKAAVDVAQKLGLKAIAQTDFTTAGLIGSYDRSAHEHNVKNGLSRGESKTIPAKKGGADKIVSYKDPIIYGDMYEQDIIFVDEAKILFMPGKHSENVLSVLQPAMDYPGKIRKKLAVIEPIEYDCSCTLVSSTVEFSSLNTELMMQGFFQRCIVKIRRFGIAERMRLMKEANKAFFNEVEYHTHITDFVDMVTHHPTDPISRERQKIFFHEGSLDIIDSVMDNWMRTLRNTVYGRREVSVIQSYIIGLSTFLFKIAAQQAVMKGNIVKKGNTLHFSATAEDIRYAAELLTPILTQLISAMGFGENKEEDQIYDTALKMMEKMIELAKDEVLKTGFIDGIGKIRNCGRKKAEKVYEALLKGNYITEKLFQGKGVMVRPNWAIMEDENKIIKERIRRKEFEHMGGG